MDIIVGSTAAMRAIPGFKRNRKYDLDLWTNVNAAYAVADDVSVKPLEILECFETESKESGWATLNDLTTIKLSHLPYDIMWNKHLNDYLVFKKHGGRINQRLYSLLKTYWKDFHDNKPFLSLYKTKDQFFDDFVTKPHDHDYLHELVAYPYVPMYTTCLKDGQEVMIDKGKFDSLAFEHKVKMFREEMAVIACERWILNPKAKQKIPFVHAWSKSVHKTTTALTKGWASEFICENIEHFLKPNRKEVEHLFNKLGVI